MDRSITATEQEHTPGYSKLKSEIAARLRVDRPDWPEEVIAAVAEGKTTKEGFDLALGGAKKADKLFLPLSDDELEKQLYGVQFPSWPPKNTERMLPSSQTTLPVDRVRCELMTVGWERDGEVITLSDEEQKAIFREVERASKPSIFCAQCRHPLGMRLPGGPKGEAPPIVYVRGPGPTPGSCKKLWWELLDGRHVQNCSHCRLHNTLGLLHALQFPDTEEHVASCSDRELHELVNHVQHDSEILERVREDWMYALGIAQLIRWKNTALVHNYNAILKVDTTRLALATARIPYYQGSAALVHKEAYVPVDGVPLFRGTRGRCPKCGHVQRLE